MSSISFTSLSVCLSVFLIFCTKNNKDDDVCITGKCNVQRPSDVYTYPVQPGTPEWTTLTTGQQQLDACQIPLDLLVRMSTEGLIQSCMDFPLLGDILLNAGVNVAGVVQNYMNSFSGFKELSKRTDAGSKMLIRYKSMDPNCARCGELYYTPDFNAFEMIIGYDSIVRKLTLSEKKELVKEALTKYNVKKGLPTYYALYGLSTSLYIACKVMVDEHHQPFISVYNQDQNLQLFTTKLLWPSDPNQLKDMFEFIINEASLFSK